MKWNLKRIGAIAAIIVLLGFAAAALIFAFIDAPWAQEALRDHGSCLHLSYDARGKSAPRQRCEQ